MTTITVDQLERLYAPFELNEHRIREGHKMSGGTKIQWFVYVDRAAVQRRLEAVFPGEWGVTQIDRNIQADYATVTLRLTICGISRDCNGGQSLRGQNDDMDQDVEKGAFTEAFRRVASMWGVGLYLYEMDERYITDSYTAKNWNEMRDREDEAWNKFTQWYKHQFGASPLPQPSEQSDKPATPKQPQRPPAPPPQPTVEKYPGTAPKPATSSAWSKKDVESLLDWAQKEYKFDQRTVMAALDVKEKFSEWTGGIEPAMVKIQLYAVNNTPF